MPETMEREVTAEAGSVRSPDRKRARWIVPLLGVGLLIIGGLVLAEAWPFSQRNVIHELELATSS